MHDPQLDRCLLVVALGLQMNLIDRATFLAATQRWLANRSQPIEAILQEMGAIQSDTLDLLSAIVAKHLELHEQDVQKSITAISTVTAFPEDLQSLRDAGDDATLHSTLMLTPGPSAGLPPSPTNRSAGQSGDRFRVLRPHAKGGLGQVLIAHDQELNRDVALKVIQERHADEPMSRSRFVLEAEITGRLEHPGIVPVYSLGQYGDGRPFYAMRFIRGDSLKVAIDDFHRGSQRDLPAGERLLLLRKLIGRLVDVCDAIAYAHDRGVLHRDLKPSNIMLGRFGETLVVDWGLAKPLGQRPVETDEEQSILVPSSSDSSDPTRIGTRLGTPGYMSPEQERGDLASLGPATDVYSLGATLYCLLTGRAPSGYHRRTDVPNSQNRMEFPPPSASQQRIPPPLRAISLKAMAERPEERYSSARSLADDLERWLADEPVTVYREPLIDRLSRSIRRHQTTFATVSVLLITMLAAFAVISGLTRLQNQRLQIARDGALQAQQQADRARLRAEENLEISSRWARRLLTLAEWVARIPGQGEMRRQVTNDSLKVLKELYENQPDEPGLRIDLAHVLRVWANLALSDDLSAALKANQEAVALLTPLASTPTAGGQIKNRLAETLRDQANLLKRAGRLSEAEAAFRLSLKTIAPPWPIDQPASVYWRTEGTVHSDLASVLIHLGRNEDAQRSAELAVTSLQRIQTEPPQHPLDPLLLLFTRTAQIERHREQNRLQEAEKILNEILPKARDLSPTDANYQHLLGKLLIEQSYVTAARDPQAAEATINESIAICEKLIEQRQDSPRLDTYRITRAEALTRRGAMRLQTHPFEADQAARAQADFSQALDTLQQLINKPATALSAGEALVETHQQLATLAGRLNEPASAQEHLQQAQAVLNQLLTAFPENVRLGHRLEAIKMQLKSLE